MPYKKGLGSRCLISGYLKRCQPSGLSSHPLSVISTRYCSFSHNSMESSSSSSFTFFFSLMALSVLSCCVNAQKIVPALYVLGDSLMDVGNNNYLPTVIKANLAHYGIDFPGGEATGRFCNGKNAVDFIAELLGLPSPPPNLSVHFRHNQTKIYLDGINFASGGAGVLRTTNENLCISLSKQVEYLGGVYEAIARELGEDGAQEHLSKSIFAVNIGSNDIFNYFKLINKPTAQHYVDSLISSLQKHLKRMYKLGAQKLMIIGLGPVGCCPFQRNDRGDCNEVANNLAHLYNHGATSMLTEMISTHPDLNYSFFNMSITVWDIFQNPTHYGFSVSEAPCCGEVGKLNAPCTPLSDCCSDRKAHVFWDFAHPTEAVVKLAASIIADGSAPYVYPINVRQLSMM